MSDRNPISFLAQLKSIPFQSLWTDIKEAISGTDRDFTSDSIGKALLILSIPMVLEMIMESIFAVVDIFFVSRLGADAVATVGITESSMTIVYAICMGLSTATTALVARRIGEKKAGKAGVVAFQAIISGLIVSILIAIPGIIYAKEFLLLMGASEEMAEAGYMFPAIMFGSNAVIMLLFIINAVFRSSGDAAVSMRVLVFANLINIVLDPLLIFGIGPFPEFGLKGAAIATTIGRGLAVCYQVYLLFHGNKRIRMELQHLKIKFKVMVQLFKLSAGGILQYIIATSSWIALYRIISELGSEVMAGYTISIRIVIFVLLPSWGLSNAASTLVGQNLGAKQPERAERTVWITGYINMFLLGLVGLILIVFPEAFIRIFIDNPEVIRNGAISLQMISIGFISYALGMVLTQAFNGSGDTATPTRINLFCFWLFEIPLAYLLAIVLDMKIYGISVAIVAAETALTLTAWYYFRKGKWKTIKV
ncbi:MAG: MATE family efflux transporter [Bacteroidota bacterium]|nr:MATE family efflux transporter [Odoribacter sp.]MDP3642851.1 MATE family efflux transporter [Bacteroidota bacterium]